MNIFALSTCPVESARMMCDKHVVKMILESCQLLSTAHHFLDGNQVIITSKNRTYTTYICELPNICKATMINHPCTIWTRTNRKNYVWLWTHAYALCNQYTLRYNKTHAMLPMLMGPLFTPPVNIVKGKLTNFPQAMPDQYKHSNAIIAYRQYYINEKARFAKWKNSPVPQWFTDKNAEIGINEEIPF